VTLSITNRYGLEKEGRVPFLARARILSSPSRAGRLWGTVKPTDREGIVFFLHYFAAHGFVTAATLSSFSAFLHPFRVVVLLGRVRKFAKNDC
jgi:hypothetical protein